VDVEEAILRRRSVRQFTDTPVDPALLARVMKAGTWAPTGSNRQPWAFIGVTRSRTLHQLRVISPGMLWEPKALVCVCSDQKKAGAFAMGPALAMFDCAMAAQNMMLEAFALGLGSCVMRSTNLAAVREILEIPQHLQPELLIMLGYPDRMPPAPARDESLIYWETYGGVKEAQHGSHGV
jgi:nitroreductase